MIFTILDNNHEKIDIKKAMKNLCQHLTIE